MEYMPEVSFDTSGFLGFGGGRGGFLWSFGAQTVPEEISG
jgi:hypothetical protein